LVTTKKILSLQTEKQGTLAEWLGTGLQNRTRRFESAKYLIKTLLKSLSLAFLRGFFFLGLKSGLTEVTTNPTRKFVVQ
jgi:hypothetical protein